MIISVLTQIAKDAIFWPVFWVFTRILT